jgi:hypothetical protein
MHGRYQFMTRVERRLMPMQTSCVQPSAAGRHPSVLSPSDDRPLARGEVAAQQRWTSILLEVGYGMTTAKMSATLDERLLAEVRARVGRRGLSGFVNQAVAEKLQRERLLELLALLEREHGPPTAAERRAAEAELHKVLRGG